MPRKPNLKKSIISVELGSDLKRRLSNACNAHKNKLTLVQAIREAVERWIATQERSVQRKKKAETEKKDDGSAK